MSPYLSEYAAIHDILISFEAIDAELNQVGKTNLKRIVSMLTRLIQRTETVSEGSIEYEYRDAEYEEMHEQTVADKGFDRTFLTCVESTRRPR